jgi:predicted secreted hydrolase
VVYDLVLDERKPPVLQHGNGYHDYDLGGYTYYFSRQRMDVEGTLIIDGESRQVTGEGWFDHQYGQLINVVASGWDWFAIQLEDDREIMLFMGHDATEVIGGTFTEADCTTRELTPEEVTVVSTGTWTSPHTGCEYPQGWEIDVAGEHFVISPYLADQEVVNDFITYWEGASAVSGDASGRAYVELAGYCP